FQRDRSAGIGTTTEPQLDRSLGRLHSCGCKAASGRNSGECVACANACEQGHRTVTRHCLYYSPGACSMAAHIVLEEIGEPYDLVLVSSRGQMGGEGTTSASWLAQNPKGRVPALSGVQGRIGGSGDLLTELHAILFYLARTHPQAHLLPSHPAGE